MSTTIEGGTPSVPPRPTTATTATVVVTYHPDPSVEERLRTIAGQVGNLVVIDNGSQPSALGPLERLAAEGTIDLILNNENQGLAAALNQGVAWAASREMPWILFFDQDTEPMDHLFEHLASVYEAYPNKSELGMIGSNWLWDHLDPPRPALNGAGEGKSAPWRELESAGIITSGCLIPRRTFEDVGGFREDLFIGHIDTEFTLRTRLHGLRTIVTQEPLMLHSLGEPARRAVGPFELTVFDHGPERWFYRFRNHLILAREYGRRDPGWVWASAKNHVLNMGKELAFGAGRLRKLAQALRGIFHGARGKTGPLHPADEARRLR